MGTKKDKDSERVLCNDSILKEGEKGGLINDLTANEPATASVSSVDASKRSKIGASAPKFTAVRRQRERCSQTRSGPSMFRESRNGRGCDTTERGRADVNLRDKVARDAHRRAGDRDFRVGGD